MEDFGNGISAQWARMQIWLEKIIVSPILHIFMNSCTAATISMFILYTNSMYICVEETTPLQGVCI